MKTIVLLLLMATPALAQTTVSAPAPEPKLPLTLSLDSQVQWHQDRSYRVLGTERASSDGGVTAALEVHRFGRGILDLGAGLRGGSDSSSSVAIGEADLMQLTPSLSAALRWRVRSWLQPQVRLAADLTWARLRLTTSDGGVLEDRAWSPGASAGAGLRLQTPTITTGPNGTGLGLALALIVEGGMHVGAPLSFAVERPKPADSKLAADRIPAASVPVGDLGRVEPYLRISLALAL